jgi:hypothetical protein
MNDPIKVADRLAKMQLLLLVARIWWRLPLEIRRRWWRETSYSRRPHHASAELVKIIRMFADTDPVSADVSPEPELSGLATLKAEMVAAHPDRGGSNAAFIKARKRYVDARRRRHGVAR